jgi:hypothetical protein
MIILQSLLALCLIHGVFGQFSYVPSRAFCACIHPPNSDQLLITHSTPNTDISTVSNPSPYTLALGDVHNNIDHYAIVYSGHWNPSNSTEVAFTIQTISNTNTQFVFDLQVYGATTIRQINFALLIVGTEGLGNIEVVPFGKKYSSIDQTTNLVRTTAGYTYSLIQTYTTTIPSTFIARAILSTFKIKQ